jgi:hypothetical protein
MRDCYQRQLQADTIDQPVLRDGLMVPYGAIRCRDLLQQQEKYRLQTEEQGFYQSSASIDDCLEG